MLSQFRRVRRALIVASILGSIGSGCALTGLDLGGNGDPGIESPAPLADGGSGGSSDSGGSDNDAGSQPDGANDASLDARPGNDASAPLCPDGGGAGGVNTTNVTLAYGGGPTLSFCGCTSAAGCDATYFASTAQGTLRYTVGDAFHPTVIGISFGGGNDVDVSVSETNLAVPANLRVFYQNQHATTVSFTQQQLQSGGVVAGAFNGVVLQGTSGSTLTISGTFHSVFP